MLALDLDPGRCLSKPAVRNMPRGGRNVTGGCDTQAAELGQLLERIGAQYVADISPSGGRHVYVLFAAPLPWLELRDARPRPGAQVPGDRHGAGVVPRRPDRPSRVPS